MVSVLFCPIGGRLLGSRRGLLSRSSFTGTGSDPPALRHSNRSSRWRRQKEYAVERKYWVFLQRTINHQQCTCWLWRVCDLSRGPMDLHRRKREHSRPPVRAHTKAGKSVHHSLYADPF